MNDVLVFGYGAVGRATVERLMANGRGTVRVAQRRRPADLLEGIAFTRCDLLDARSVLEAVAGAGQVVLAAGFAYDGQVWQRDWPRAIANVLAACEACGARMVFADNLYMYGPQDGPLREDTPLSDFGRKPSARAAVTQMWQASRVRVAALRAPDFYGPGVTLSHLGTTGLQAIAQGRAATLLVAPDMPHEFAYVPDVARAIETLLDAPDDAFGQAWHVPCAPTLSVRQILEMGAAEAGTRLKLRCIPPALLPLLGLAVPFLRELAEMRFQCNRPYHVDSAKWRARFWSDATPFANGVRATVASFATA